MNLQLKGTVEVLGREIPEISGGFGSAKRSMLAREIADFHNKRLYKVNEDINNNWQRFKVGIDVIDLTNYPNFLIHLVDNEVLSQNSVNRSKNIYLLSERGYAKLIKIFDDDLAWERYDQLLDNYFEMREGTDQPVEIEDLIIKQAQSVKELKQKVNKQQEQIESTQREVEDMRETIIETDEDWRNWVNNTLNKIAFKNGKYKEIRTESYEILEDRARCRLGVRLDNLKNRKRENGATQTEVKNTRKLDVIERDKRLKEIYTAIVKELAVKYSA